MPALPAEWQLPPEIHEAVKQKSFEGQQQLIAWLFMAFSARVNHDHLLACLLEFTTRLRGGFVPDEPVGYFETMLFGRGCDARRKEERRSELLPLALESKPGAPVPDPAELCAKRDLWKAVFHAVLFHFSPPVSTLLLARMYGWKLRHVRSSLEAGSHERWSEKRARRAYLEARRALRARFGDGPET
jgi:hypothetical protein